MIYYHGTTSMNAENIKKNGISPDNSKYAGKVYLTTNYGEASKYAKIASNGKPGKVLKIHSDNLKSEHIHSNNSGIIEYKGSIHPQHISEETNVGMIAGSGDHRLPPDQREPGFNINIKKNKKILRRKKLNLEELQLKLNEDVESLTDEELLSLVENIDRLDELSRDTLKSYIMKAKLAGHAYRGLQLWDDNPDNKNKYARRASNRQKGIDTAIKKLMAKKTANEDYLVTNRDLIEAVIEQSPSVFYERFSNSIYSKIRDYIDNMKEDVAKDLFESGRLDELSKETLLNYVKAANHAGHAYRTMQSQANSNATYYNTGSRSKDKDFYRDKSIRDSVKYSRHAYNRQMGIDTAIKKLMAKDQAEK